MPAPSDHLLRTVASVSPDVRILDLECREGRHTAALALLGFSVYACDGSEAHVAATRRRLQSEGVMDDVDRYVTVAHPHALSYPDDFFAWIVAFEVLNGHISRHQVLDVLAEARRVLEPGGWLYVAVPAPTDDVNPCGDEARFASDSGVRATFTPDALNVLFDEADFAVAAEPRRFEERDDVLLHAVYRRVEAHTSV